MRKDRKTIFIGLFLIWVCMACNPHRESTPGGLLNEEKLVDILVDVQILESTLDLGGMKQDQINKAMAPEYMEIMKKHQVTYDQFTATYDYYLHHPDEMDAVYEAVVNKLTALESEVKMKRKPNPSGKDSIPR